MLVGPQQQSIPQLLSLSSRVYKGYRERSTCGSELTSLQGFATGRCCPCPVIRGLEPRPLPTPAGQGQHRAKTRTRNLACGLGRGNEASKHPYPASAFT